MEAIEYLWSDKKRYLGMPISFTRYALSSERLFTESGLLVTRNDQTLLYRVQDIKVTRTLWQRFFGVGTVTVVGTDKSMPNLELVNVQNPLYVKELIHQNVEALRTKKGVRAGEVIG